MKKSLGVLALGFVLAIPAIVSADTPRIHLQNARLSCDGADLRLDFRLVGLDDFEDARVRLTARAEVECSNGRERTRNISEVDSFEANRRGRINGDVTLSAERLCPGNADVEDVRFSNVRVTVTTEGRSVQARVGGSKRCSED